MACPWCAWSSHPLPASQIIFITGYQDFENAHAAIRLHACAFLLKPIHDSQLLEAIALAKDEIQKKCALHDTGFSGTQSLLTANAPEAFEEKLSSIYRKAIYLVQKALMIPLIYCLTVCARSVPLSCTTSGIWHRKN